MSDDVKGFAQIPHILTMYKPLSDGAYRTYALLLKYSRQHGACWAAHSTLAAERHTTRQTIVRHLKELERLGLITREKRKGTSDMMEVKTIEDGV